MQNNYQVLEPGKELWNRVRVAGSDYFDFEMSEVDLPSYGRRHICTTWVLYAEWKFLVSTKLFLHIYVFHDIQCHF